MPKTEPMDTRSVFLPHSTYAFYGENIPTYVRRGSWGNPFIKQSNKIGLTTQELPPNMDAENPPKSPTRPGYDKSIPLRDLHNDHPGRKAYFPNTVHFGQWINPTTKGIVPSDLKREIYGQDYKSQVAAARNYNTHRGYPTDQFERLDKIVPVQHGPPGFQQYGETPFITSALFDSDVRNLNSGKDWIKDPDLLAEFGGFTPKSHAAFYNSPGAAKAILKHETDHAVYTGSKGTQSNQYRSKLKNLYNAKMRKLNEIANKSRFLPDNLAFAVDTDGYMTDLGTYGTNEADPAMARIQEHMFSTTGKRLESPADYLKWVQKYDKLTPQNADEYPGFNSLPADVQRFLINRSINGMVPKGIIDSYYGNRIPGYVQNSTRNPFTV